MANNVTIDINKLNETELEQLSAMFYRLGQMETCRDINNRIAFLKGWTERSQG